MDTVDNALTLKSRSMKILILVLSTLIPLMGQAQTIVFNEGFEAGLGGMSQGGSSSWISNDSIMHTGAQSLHNNYNSNNNSTLYNTVAMDLSSYNGALLEFNHICKVELADMAIVLISDDGGGSWDTLGSDEYSGQAFMFQGNKFFDGSYTEWDYNNDGITDFIVPNPNDNYVTCSESDAKCRENMRIGEYDRTRLHSWSVWIGEVQANGEINYTKQPLTGVRAPLTDLNLLDYDGDGFVDIVTRKGVTRSISDLSVDSSCEPGIYVYYNQLPANHLKLTQIETGLEQFHEFDYQ